MLCLPKSHMLPSVRYFGNLLVFVQSLSIQCRNPEYVIGPLISANFRYCLFLKLFKALGMCLFVFVALRPMSTAMVIAGRSVHLTALFPGQA